MSKSEELLPPSWPRRRLGDWTVSFGEAVQLSELIDANGAPIGLLLGVAVDRGGSHLSGTVVIDCKANADDFEKTVEDFVAGLAGRFAVLVITKKFQRIYGDPTHSFPWVHDAAMQICGSTISLVARYPLEPNPQFEPKALLLGRVSLTFGETVDRRVRRCLPNNYLDLTDFTTHRFWPKSLSLLSEDQEIDLAIEKIVARLTAILRALTAAKSCALSVTGGHDSRILLACSFGFLDELSEMSNYRFHNASRVDSRMARDMLADLGHKVKIYYKEPRTRTQFLDHRLKSGWSSTHEELAALAMLERYPKDSVILRGGMIELTRASQWRSDRIGRPAKVYYGLRRLRLTNPSCQFSERDWADDYRDWLRTLPENSIDRAYDCAYVELWLPSELGAYYAGFHNNFFMDPFNDRELIALITGISPERRKSGDIVRRILRRAAPDIPSENFH